MDKEINGQISLKKCIKIASKYAREKKVHFPRHSEKCRSRQQNTF